MPQAYSAKALIPKKMIIQKTPQTYCKSIVPKPNINHKSITASIIINPKNLTQSTKNEEFKLPTNLSKLISKINPKSDGTKTSKNEENPIYLFFLACRTTMTIQHKPFPLHTLEHFFNCVKIMTKKQVNVLLHP